MRETIWDSAQRKTFRRQVSRVEGSLVPKAWTMLVLQWNPEGLLLITFQDPASKKKKERKEKSSLGDSCTFEAFSRGEEPPTRQWKENMCVRSCSTALGSRFWYLVEQEQEKVQQL